MLSFSAAVSSSLTPNGPNFIYSRQKSEIVAAVCFQIAKSPKSPNNINKGSSEENLVKLKEVKVIKNLKKFVNWKWVKILFQYFGGKTCQTEAGQNSIVENQPKSPKSTKEVQIQENLKHLNFHHRIFALSTYVVS